MYFYEIGYYTEEESGYIQLYHKEKFTKKEFNNMFIFATLEFLLYQRKKYHWIPAEEGEISEYDKESLKKSFKEDNLGYKTEKKYIESRSEFRYYTSFDCIYKQVAEIMVLLYNFKYIKYEQEIEVQGWGQIVNKNRRFGEDDKLLNRIRKKFWEKKKKKDEKNNERKTNKNKEK